MNIGGWYIFRSLLAPVAFVGLTITGLLLLDRIYQFLPFFELADVSILQFIQILLYTLPPVIFLVLPVSMLVGCYIGLNILSKNAELVAFQSIGLPVRFFLKPVLVLAVLITTLCALFSLWLSPLSFTKLESLKFGLLVNSSKFKFDPQKLHHFGDYLIFTHSQQDDQLEGLFIANWNEPSQHSVVTGQKAKLNVLAKQGKIVFEITDGWLHLPIQAGNYQLVEFENLSFPIQIPIQSRNLLPSRYRALTSQKTVLEEKLEYSMSWSELLTARDNTDNEIIYYEFWTEFVSRFVPPLTCISFALVALAFGVSLPRSGSKLNSLFLLATLIVNYTLFTRIQLLADQAKINPWLHLLTPTIIAIFALGVCEYRYKAFSK